MKKFLITMMCVMMVIAMMPAMAFAEGAAVEVSTYEELVTALETPNANIIMTADITADATQSSGYGKAGIVLDAGDILDGNGKKLTITSANSTWDCAVAMRGGEVKNLTIAGAMRGVFMPGANGDVVVDTCVFEDVIYTFNSDAGSKDYSVTIKNTTLNGWTSFSDVHKSVIFEGCNFGEGNGYSFCRPYQATTFINCDFDGGFSFDNSRSNELDFNECTYNEEPLSADNNEMFYNGGTVKIDGTETNVSYVAKIGEERYLSLEEALADAAAGEIIIEMLRDATLDYDAREAYGVAETATITINGNGKTITMNQKDSDWSSFGMANPDGKVILNNLTIEKTGYGDTSGAWNTHTINWTCEVEMNNVTVNNSVAFSKDAVLNDVTINEAGDYYAIWITAEGQTVDIDGLTVNSAGRGIKIADQYVTPTAVALNIENASFDTVKKAAVLVSSTEGATIQVGDNVDISNVTEDPINVVWIDEEWSTHADEVIVIGGSMITEGHSLITVEAQDFGLWGESWRGAYNVGWTYSADFDLNDIIALEVGIKDAAGKDILTYTANIDQVRWQHGNGWIGRPSSAPFYKEYQGTEIEEGAADDWTVIKGEAFEDFAADKAYVKVSTANCDYVAEWDAMTNHTHVWDAEYTVVKEATETETGLKVKECTDANCIAKDSVVIPKVVPTPSYYPTVTVEKPVVESAENATVTLGVLGTTATIAPAEGYEIADVTVNGVSKGAVTSLSGLKTGDKIVVITKAIEVPKTEAELVQEQLDGMALVARSKRTAAPSGKDSIMVYWYDKAGAELDFDGVEIFRSTKKSEGFKKVFTSKTDKYYNTAIEEGVKYYYRVRGYVTVDGEKLYTDWSLKAIRTAK
ncbi:MAG: pentapeptide repeat-containing protein [Firmicutes bacterium]|nr:pentapeptide repeat-containing protein [Bacillota bacterium]